VLNHETSDHLLSLKNQDRARLDARANVIASAAERKP